MTVYRYRFLVNKTNWCTEFQFYWYYYCTCFGQPFCPSSGVLSLTSALVHFMQLWCGSNRSSQLYKMYQRQCTAKNSWWWAERLPETCRVVIPIKLEFTASVGFIHREPFKNVYLGRVRILHCVYDTLFRSTLDMLDKRLVAGLTMETSPYRIYGAQSGTGTMFTSSNSVLPCLLYNLSNWQFLKEKPLKNYICCAIKHVTMISIKVYM